MKILALAIAMILPSCLLSAKKGEQEPEEYSADAAAAIAPEQDVDEFLISECYIIYKNARYIYNFYQETSDLKNGSIYAVEPVPPLNEPYYEIRYKDENKKIVIEFVDQSEELLFEIEKSNWQGVLTEKTKNRQTKFTCEEFLI